MPNTTGQLSRAGGRLLRGHNRCLAWSVLNIYTHTYTHTSASHLGSSHTDYESISICHACFTYERIAVPSNATLEFRALIAYTGLPV